MKKKYFIFSLFLNKNGYYITEQSLRERFLSDPNNDVTSITNTLDYFNIKNMVATVPKTALNQLPQTFIAQVSSKGNFFIVLACKESDDKVKIYIDENKSFTNTTQDFLSDWTGLIVAIEPNNNSKPKNNTNNILTNLAISTAIVSILVYQFLYTNSFFSTIYLLLSIFGLAVSGFIIKEKFGLNSITSKFCTLTKSTDCLAVLNSKEAKLFGFLDLSEISVIYFSFLTLTSIINPYSMFFLISSCFSMPIIVYSIFYQFFKIKKWCPLCLSIASILVLQFAFVIPIYKHFAFNFKDLFLNAFVFGIVAIGWTLIKPLLINTKRYNELSIENLKFRRNHNLFLPYYNTLRKLDTEPDSVFRIQTGSVNPCVTITAITNPLCKMCTEAHKTYASLLKKHPGKIQINYIFLVPYADRNDVKTQISERLIQLYKEENSLFKQALNDWFENLDVNKWLRKWGVCSNMNYNHILFNQVKWCLSNEIESTPILLINGKLFPDSYTPSDLENFIEHIIVFENNKEIKEIENIHA